MSQYTLIWDEHNVDCQTCWVCNKLHKNARTYTYTHTYTRMQGVEGRGAVSRTVRHFIYVPLRRGTVESLGLEIAEAAFHQSETAVFMG